MNGGLIVLLVVVAVFAVGSGAQNAHPPQNPSPDRPPGLPPTSTRKGKRPSRLRVDANSGRISGLNAPRYAHPQILARPSPSGDIGGRIQKSNIEQSQIQGTVSRGAGTPSGGSGPGQHAQGKGQIKGSESATQSPKTLKKTSQARGRTHGLHEQKPAEIPQVNNAQPAPPSQPASQRSEGHSIGGGIGSPGQSSSQVQLIENGRKTSEGSPQGKIASRVLVESSTFQTRISSHVKMSSQSTNNPPAVTKSVGNVGSRHTEVGPTRRGIPVSIVAGSTWSGSSRFGVQGHSGTPSRASIVDQGQLQSQGQVTTGDPASRTRQDTSVTSNHPGNKSPPSAYKSGTPTDTKQTQSGTESQNEGTKTAAQISGPWNRVLQNSVLSSESAKKPQTGIYRAAGRLGPFIPPTKTKQQPRFSAYIPPSSSSGSDAPPDVVASGTNSASGPSVGQSNGQVPGKQSNGRTDDKAIVLSSTQNASSITNPTKTKTGHPPVNKQHTGGSGGGKLTDVANKKPAEREGGGSQGSGGSVSVTKSSTGRPKPVTIVHPEVLSRTKPKPTTQSSNQGHTESSTTRENGGVGSLNAGNGGLGGPNGGKSGGNGDTAGTNNGGTGGNVFDKPCSSTPVCASDGFTYLSDCYLRPGLEKACDGFCPCQRPPPPPRPAARPPTTRAPYEPPPCKCPHVYAPVCGINGKTYDNDCQRRCNYVGSNCAEACPCHSKRKRRPSKITIAKYNLTADGKTQKQAAQAAALLTTARPTTVAYESTTLPFIEFTTIYIPTIQPIPTNQTTRIKSLKHKVAPVPVKTTAMPKGRKPIPPKGRKPNRPKLRKPNRQRGRKPVRSKSKPGQRPTPKPTTTPIPTTPKPEPIEVEPVEVEAGQPGQGGSSPPPPYYDYYNSGPPGPHAQGNNTQAAPYYEYYNSGPPAPQAQQAQGQRLQPEPRAAPQPETQPAPYYDYYDSGPPGPPATQAPPAPQAHGNKTQTASYYDYYNSAPPVTFFDFFNTGLNSNNRNINNQHTDNVYKNPGLCSCPKYISLVCGTNGLTYENPCTLNCAYVELDCDGECPCYYPVADPSPATCESQCSNSYEPVCTIDGNTYDNDCMRECSGEYSDCDGECPCQSASYSSHPDVNNESSNQPLSTCECAPNDVDPVCTTDGETLWYGCEAICLGTTIACSSSCPC